MSSTTMAMAVPSSMRAFTSVFQDASKSYQDGTAKSVISSTGPAP